MIRTGALLPLLLAGCTPAPPGPTAGPSQCLRASEADTYREVGQAAVNVRTRRGEVWRIDFAGDCPDVAWTLGPIALKPRHHSDLVCSGFDVDVLVGDGRRPRRCMVSGVRALSAAEVAALPPEQRP